MQRRSNVSGVFQTLYLNASNGAISVSYGEISYFNLGSEISNGVIPGPLLNNSVGVVSEGMNSVVGYFFWRGGNKLK